MHSKSHRSYVGILSVVLAACVAGSLNAATVNVSTTTDENDGSLGGGAGVSLREAILYCAAGDTINVPDGTYTITLTGAAEDAGVTGDFDIVRNMTIVGASQAGVIINTGGTSRPFDIHTGTVSISNFTLQGGADDLGGGVRVHNAGIVTLNSVVINACTSNAASSFGGGVYNTGTLTMTNCRVANCTFSAAAPTQTEGGGIFTSGILTMTGCTVENNTMQFAAGMYNSGTANLSSCTFTNNRSTSSGGAVYNYGKITLTSCTLNTNTITAAGGGGAGVFLDGRGAGTVTMTGCTVTNCTTLGNGGAVATQNGGTVTITDSTITGSSAVFGGALLSVTDDVTLTNVIFDVNNSTSSGGGFYNFQGTANLTNVTITNSHAAGTGSAGGALVNDGGQMTIKDSRIANNIADNSAGGLWNTNPGAVANVTNTTFSGNRGGNDDGGILLDDPGATLNCEGCVIDTSIGGALNADTGTAILSNCTISGNTAATQGAGIFVNTAALTVSCCTITNNRAPGGGGGIYNAAGTVLLQSSILAGNFTTGTTVNDGFGAFVPASAYNLIGLVGTMTGFDVANNNQIGTAAPLNPQLAALADNGGPTRTHALLSNSPALDTGNSGGFLLDQRGYLRVVNNLGIANAPGGDGCDIGALESQTAFIVRNTNDAGADSLRAALLAAAITNNPSAPNVVLFRIPTAATYTIALASALPVVNSQLLIDATTQPDFNGKPIIELNGTNAGPLASGFVLAAHRGSLVRGFIINRFPANGVDIEQGGDHLVSLNYIGTDVPGAIARANTLAGVRIFNADGNRIGVDNTNANVLSGNGGNGVLIEGPLSSGNLIQGNNIGTGATSTVRIANTLQGVWMTTGASNNVVGTNGDGANDIAEGNIISNNIQQGVLIDSGNGNKVQRNSIDGNGALGIDLGVAGPGANDAGDIDVGANGLQNYPILNSINGTTAGGTLLSTASAAFRIEVFDSPAFDLLGFGEGAKFLGSADVTTDAQGVAAFTVTLSAAPTGVVTATATGANGTSEFSGKNIPPTISVPAAVTTQEDISVFIAPITASDPDSGLSKVELKFTAIHGNTTIDTAVPNGIAAGDVTGNGTHDVTVLATIGAINTTLNTNTSITYRGDTDYNGSDTLTVSIDDKAPPALGGGQAASGSVAITITPVVDKPKVTNVTTLEDTQTPTGVIVESVDGPQFTFFKITSIQGGKLYQNDGVTEITNGTFVPAAEAKLGLKFTPVADSNANGTFVAQQSTSNDDAGLTGPTATAVVTVTAVADAPTLSVQDVSGNEGAAIALTITPALKDTDGSEVISVQLTGVPVDAVFSNGVQNPGTGLVDIAQGDLANLTITIPDNQASNAAYVLTVNAIATEQSNSDTEVTTKTLRVTVLNVAPALTNVAATSVNENGTVHLTGSMADPGTDSLTLTVDWGDGAPEDFPFAAGSTTFDLTHQYLDDNPTNTGSDVVNISLILKDKDNGQATTTAPSTITNVAPVGVVFTGLTALEGAAVNFDLGTFTDVGPVDTHSAKIDWGDGTPQTDAVITEAGIDPGSIKAAHAYADNRATPYDVTVTLKDDDGGTHVLNTTVTVSNVVPTAEFRKADTANTATLGAVRFSLQNDPSSADTTAGFHYAFDFNNDSTFDLGDGTYAGSQTTGDATVPANFITSNPNQTVRGRIIDKDGGFKDYLLRKPTVTSALTATANIGSQFTYILTGDGEPPLPPLGPASSVFLVTDAGGTLTLAQAGLAFTNGNRISGIIPDIVGTVKLKITASTLAGTDEVTLTINVRDPNNLNDPTFTSPATATPALTLVNIPVQFSAAGTDADNNPITFSWAFGDGTTGTGATPSHAYTTPGNFIAVVTLNDGRYSVTQDVPVTVLDPNVNPLTVTTAALSFDFKKNTNHSLSIKGSVAKGSLTAISGAVIDFIIVGSLYERVFTLDAKGGAKVGTATFKAKLNTKTNIITWSIAEKNPVLFTQLTPVGFKNETTTKELPMGIIMKVGSDPHAAVVTMVYKATAGKSGKAAKKKK